MLPCRTRERWPTSSRSSRSSSRTTLTRVVTCGGCSSGSHCPGRARSGRRRTSRCSRGHPLSAGCVSAYPACTSTRTGTGPSLGGPTGKPIRTRDSIMDLWRKARRDLEDAGAVVVEVDFPAVSNYEGDRPGAPMIDSRGVVPSDFRKHEDTELTAWGLDQFLRSNGDPRLHRLVDADPAAIQPTEPGTLPGREGDDLGADLGDSVSIAETGITPWADIPTMEGG